MRKRIAGALIGVFVSLIFLAVLGVVLGIMFGCGYLFGEAGFLGAAILEFIAVFAFIGASDAK